MPLRRREHSREHHLSSLGKNFCLFVFFLIMSTSTFGTSEDLMFGRALSSLERSQSGNSVGFQVASTTEQRDDLVAFFELRDGKMSDSSGHKINTTTYGTTAVRDRFGRPISATHFNGSSRILILEPESLLNVSVLTISVWVQLNTTSTDPATDHSQKKIEAILGSFWENEGACYSLFVNYDPKENGGSERGVSFNVGSTDGSWMSEGRGSTFEPLPLNQWILITAVISPSKEYSIYFNQYKVGSWQPKSDILFSSNCTLNIGWSQFSENGSSRFFVGDVDSVRIYTRVLSGDEIASLVDINTTWSPMYRWSESAKNTNNEKVVRWIGRGGVMIYIVGDIIWTFLIFSYLKMSDWWNSTLRNRDAEDLKNTLTRNHITGTANWIVERCIFSIASICLIISFLISSTHYKDQQLTLFAAFTNVLSMYRTEKIENSMDGAAWIVIPSKWVVVTNMLRLTETLFYGCLILLVSLSVSLSGISNVTRGILFSIVGVLRIIPIFLVFFKCALGLHFSKDEDRLDDLVYELADDHFEEMRDLDMEREGSLYYLVWTGKIVIEIGKSVICALSCGVFIPVVFIILIIFAAQGSDPNSDMPNVLLSITSAVVGWTRNYQPAFVFVIPATLLQNDNSAAYDSCFRNLRSRSRLITLPILIAIVILGATSVSSIGKVIGLFVIIGLYYLFIILCMGGGTLGWHIPPIRRFYESVLIYWETNVARKCRRRWAEMTGRELKYSDEEKKGPEKNTFELSSELAQE